jgi:GT2 family glycosyltransferase
MVLKTAEPKVGIVILNWNRADDTIACVHSLKRMAYGNYEVVLVDNGSRDDSVERLRSTFPDIHLIDNQQNLGFAQGNNIGIAHLLQQGCDYVMLLNDDAEVGPDTISRLIEFAESDPLIGVVGPTICYYAQPRTIWSAGGAVTPHGEPSHLDVDQDLAVVGTSPRDVAYVTGCAILVKRAVVDQIGVLDDRFFIYFEETEWCARAQQAGFRVVHVPESVMWHKVTPTARASSPRYLYLMARNRLLYLRLIGAGTGAILAAATDLLRTVASWTLKPGHRANRALAPSLVRGIGAFAIGRYGPPPADL